MTMRAGAVVLALVSVLTLSACGSPASKSGPGTPPRGQSLIFENGWNYVAFGLLDTVASVTVAMNCANDTTGLGFPDEPGADIGHFAVQAADQRKWRAGCDAAAKAIKALGSAALAEGGRTPLTPYPAPAEQKTG